MEENYLTEGSFKASIDSLIDSKFGEGYTLQDVGELVELTEMTLEDRMELMTKTIDNDFEDMSKSLDNLQKSLYDMLDLLTDSQVDLKDSAEHGGITDADIQKIVDGLKLEEKFFPHLYQYLDERFGLNEDKIKNFRSRTEKVIDADLGEVPVGDEREGRTESTAKINRELDKDRDKKVGKKAFEDQAVFSSRLKLWTEGHKEPSKQGDDKEDKKDNKKDDESLLSKIVKIGMIAGMIVEILKNSPELVNTIKDIFTGENGLFPRLQKVLDDLKLGDKIVSAFQSVKEWFKEEFSGVVDMISKIYNFVESTYYSMMSPEEQEEYARNNPESDLAVWRKAGGGQLNLWDTSQFMTALAGDSGKFVREAAVDIQKSGGVEEYANAISGGLESKLWFLRSAVNHMSEQNLAKLLPLLNLPDTFEYGGSGDKFLDPKVEKLLLQNGAQKTLVSSELDALSGVSVEMYTMSNVKSAIDSYIGKIQKADEAVAPALEQYSQELSTVRSAKAISPYIAKDNRTDEQKAQGDVLEDYLEGKLDLQTTSQILEAQKGEGFKLPEAPKDRHMMEMSPSEVKQQYNAAAREAITQNTVRIFYSQYITKPAVGNGFVMFNSSSDLKQ